MDTRLIELLPRAMNMRAGDAKIIKTAGGIVAHPFGGAWRACGVQWGEGGICEEPWLHSAHHTAWVKSQGSMR